MRHRVRGRKLGRTASHRTATLRALATSLLKHKKIKTTVAKAKELRTFVEPMITRAKTDSVHARRLIAQDINDKAVIKELFDEIVTKIGDRKGGYTRVVKLGNRFGDGAEMAIIELVDFNDVAKVKERKPKAKKAKPEVADAEIISEKVDNKDEAEESTAEPMAEEKPKAKLKAKTETKEKKETKKSTKKDKE